MAATRSPNARLFVLHFALLVPLAFLAIPALAGGRREAVRQLPAVEVREYQGQNLSSINDFRENSIRGPQEVDRAAFRLRVDGQVGRPLELTYGQVLQRQRFRKVVTLNCVEGWSATILWEGMRVRDLIGEAEPRDAARTVIFHAVDGYTTSFPLAYLRDRDILLAFRMNEVELPAERGFPFQLVAEDKWGYKWIKWVTRVELSEREDYRGYWESRGYSNQGDLSQPMFGD